MPSPLHDRYQPSSLSYYSYAYIIGVDIEFHRKGVGKALMKWGMDQAAKEDVPLYLESSPAYVFHLIPSHARLI